MANANEPSKKFAQMDAGEKLQFMGKLVLFFVTFGFAFANILSD